MNIGLIFFYVLSFMGLLASAALHGKEKPESAHYYNLPLDMVRTIIELLLIWWIVGWRIL